MTGFEFPWWVYVSFVFSFFGVCMALNYLVKKLNEAKIEERLIRMLHKASTTQSTQVTGPLIAVETRGAARHDSLRTIQRPSPPGISLVFNREDNKRRSDPYSLIKPIIPRRSMENINVKSPNERTASSLPLKRIESAQVVAKANSSHISTEKVFLKTNEYGNQAVRKTSSTAKSDRYVAKLITVKKNEYGHVSGLGTYSVCRKRSNTNELNSEIKRLTAGESTPSIHVKDERAIENVARMDSGRKAEEPTPKKKIDVTEKVLFQKNIYTSRIIRTKTSIVDITLEKQDVNDKESNEEIDTGCSIKKSVESIISKIASNLKIKNEDPKIDKNVAGTLIAATQSSSNSGSGLKITEISSAEKRESICNTATDSSSPSEKIVPQYIKRSYSDSKSNCLEEHVKSENIVLKKISSQSHSDHGGENILFKKVESGHIAIKETAPVHSHNECAEVNIMVKKDEPGHISDKETTSAHPHIELAVDNIPVKIVELGNVATKETTSTHSHIERSEDNTPVKKAEPGHVTTKESISVNSFERVRENVPVKKVDSKHFAAKETISSHFKDDREGENILVENVESGHIPTKETTSTHLYNERAVDNILVKKVESGHVTTKETTFSHSNDDRVGNIIFKRIESEHLTANESSLLYAGIELPKKELVSVKKSVTLIESRRGDCETPSSILRKAREYAPIKKIDAPDEEGATGRTEARGYPFHIESSITLIKQSINKQKAAPIATKETRIDNNIAESSDAKMSKAAHNAAEAKYSKGLVLENKKEDIESKEELKTRDDPEEEEPNKSLTAKIKELLEDEDTVELKLYIPSPSSKSDCKK